MGKKDRVKPFTEVHTVIVLRAQLNLRQKFQWKYLKILQKVKESQRKQTDYKKSNKCIHKSSIFQLLSLCYVFYISISFFS